MSRHVGAIPSVPRRGPHWSHLRHSSATSSDRSSADSPASPGSASTHSTVKDDKRRKPERCCVVTVNEGYSRDEVLLNLDLIGGDVRPGSLMAIAALKGDSAKPSAGYGSISKQAQDANDCARSISASQNEQDTVGHRYIFVAKDMSKEMKARQPELEVYVVKHIADAFGMKKGGLVMLTPVRSPAPSLATPTAARPLTPF